MKVVSGRKKHPIPLLLPVIVLFISKFWMVPFRKKQNGQVLQNTSWKTVEKPVEKPVENH
jgi:hypothetical protein